MKATVIDLSVGDVSRLRVERRRGKTQLVVFDDGDAPLVAIVLGRVEARRLREALS